MRGWIFLAYPGSNTSFNDLMVGYDKAYSFLMSGVTLAGAHSTRSRLGWARSGMKGSKHLYGLRLYSPDEPPRRVQFSSHRVHG